MKAEYLINRYKSAITQPEKDRIANEFICLIIKTPVCDKWKFVLKDLPDETWEPVKGFEEGYEISNYGRLKHLPRFRWCLPKGENVWYKEKISEYRQTFKNYSRTNLTKDKIAYSVNIHVLVGLHFLEPVKGKDWINHKDGNKRNNHVSNLEWCTHEENMRHARATGLNNDINENSVQSKITNREAIEIFNSPLNHLELAELYNLSPSNISCIKRGVTWKNLTGKVYEKKNKAKTKRVG